MIYNFRFARDKTPEILRRLRDEKLLSQGWGGGPEGNLRVDREEFVRACQDHYRLPTTKIPSSLARMRNFKDGDLLVVPHLPESGLVSMHVVDGDFPSCYDYKPSDPDHINHRIRVRESIGLDGTVSARTARLLPWFAKLGSYRLPVMDISRFEAGFLAVLSEARTRPEVRQEASGLDDYLTGLRTQVLRSLRQSLADTVRPSGRGVSFESVCERLLTSSGYRVVRRNQYDRAGGDVDLECVRERSDASPFETGQTVLFVQVKKHAGTTDSPAVNQLLEMLKQRPNADACVMSLADDFSPEATALAGPEIRLMNGDEIAGLLLAELARLGGGLV